MVDILHVGNLAETAPPEFGRICKHNRFLGGLHHDAVKACFHHVGGGDTEIEVDTVYTDE